MSIWDNIFNQDPLSDRAILRNARRTGRETLRKYKADNPAADESGAFEMNSLVPTVSAAIGGVTGLVENYDRGSSIQDTEGLENQIQEYGNIGRGTYNDYDQLASDFGQLDLAPDIDEDEIRGMTTGQKWGNLASGAATGLSAGAAIGSIIPGIGTGIGAAVGAGIGAITSGLSILAGDEEARRQKEYLENLKSVASQKATINLGLAHEDLRERQNREGIYNLSAQGGRINRGESIQKFADRVMKRPRVNDSSASTVKVRHGEGGTIIRIKR